MFNTKEESGCLVVESSLKFLSMPLQIAGTGLLFASLMLLPVFNALVGLAFALAGAALLASGFKLQRSREFVFDPYLKRVFWKHCESSGSREGSVAFSEISHVLIDCNPHTPEEAGLSLLVGNEKMPVLGELKTVAPSQRKDMEKLAERIKKIVGAY